MTPVLPGGRARRPGRGFISCRGWTVGSGVCMAGPHGRDCQCVTGTREGRVRGPVASRPWGPHPMCVMKSFLKKKDAPTVTCLQCKKGSGFPGKTGFPSASGAVGCGSLNSEDRMQEPHVEKGTADCWNVENTGGDSGVAGPGVSRSG